MKKIYLLLVFVLIYNSSKAQLYYNFNSLDGSPTSGVPTGFSASPVTANNTDRITDFFTTSSPSVTYSGNSGGGNITTIARDGRGGIPVSALSYFELTITPSVTEQVRVASIGFGSRSISGSGGPTTVVIRSSVNNYSAAVDSLGINSSSVWTLYNRTLAITGTVGAPVTIRIYARNGTGGTANNWRIDDLNIGLITTLPLTWLDFNVKKEGDGSVNLLWKVSEQVNTQSFEIERLNVKGEFVAIGSKPSINQKSITLYSFIDNKPLSGDNYYRIKQLDIDGKFTYSKEVAIDLSNRIKSWEVYPNPVTSLTPKFYLKLYENIPDLAFRLVDSSGKILIDKSFKNLESGQEIIINEENLNTGIYMLQVNAKGLLETVKLIAN